MSVVSFVSWLLCAILQTIDDLVSIPVSLLRLKSKVFKKKAEDLPHVVVVGGSFAGLWSTRHLEQDFRVTLVDYKDYFEYTPGCLRTLVDVHHLDSITGPILHPHSTATLLKAELQSVDPDARTITVKNEAGADQVVSYDYLLVGTGSDYPAPFKPSRSERSLEARKNTWSKEFDKLKAAETVLVVGGGLVGVEVVGEILAAYPDKRITVVDGGDLCCRNLPESTVRYTDEYLRENKVTMEMNARITTQDPSQGFPKGLAITDTSVTLEDGRVLKADVVYRCMGMKPASEPLRNGGLSGALNGRGDLMVGDTLQVCGQERVFGMGDVMLHEATREIKLGHTAEVNAHVVVENVKRLQAGEALLKYPEGATGADRTPRIFCLSLGPDDGSLGFNSLVINGTLAAIVKHFLEWSKVRQQADTPLGRFIWVFGDWFSCLLGRTVLYDKKPSEKEDAAKPAERNTRRVGVSPLLALMSGLFVFAAAGSL